MSVPFAIKIEATSLTAAMQGMVGRARNMGPALSAVGQKLIDSTQTRFETSKDPDGNPWAPLAASTIKERERKGFWPGKTLVRSGALHRDYLSKVVVRDTVVVTNDAPYAALQNYGGTIERHAHTVLDKFLTLRFREVDAEATKKDGSIVKYKGKRFVGKKKKATHTADAMVVVGAANYTIPARTFMGINANDEETARTVISNYLTTGDLT